MSGNHRALGKEPDPGWQPRDCGYGPRTCIPQQDSQPPPLPQQAPCTQPAIPRPSPTTGPFSTDRTLWGEPGTWSKRNRRSGSSPLTCCEIQGVRMKGPWRQRLQRQPAASLEDTLRPERADDGAEGWHTVPAASARPPDLDEGLSLCPRSSVGNRVSKAEEPGWGPWGRPVRPALGKPKWLEEKTGTLPPSPPQHQSSP